MLALSFAKTPGLNRSRLRICSRLRTAVFGADIYSVLQEQAVTTHIELPATVGREQLRGIVIDGIAYKFTESGKLCALMFRPPVLPTLLDFGLDTWTMEYHEICTWLRSIDPLTSDRKKGGNAQSKMRATIAPTLGIRITESSDKEGDFVLMLFCIEPWSPFYRAYLGDLERQHVHRLMLQREESLLVERTKVLRQQVEELAELRSSMSP